MAVLTGRTHSMATNAAAKNGTTPEEELAKRTAKLPSGRFGSTEEFGAMVAFLAGQYGGYCTGSNFRIDGGFVASL